jgi:hypothetical protein
MPPVNAHPSTAYRAMESDFESQPVKRLKTAKNAHSHDAKERLRVHLKGLKKHI